MYGTPWHGTFARIKPEGLEIAGMFYLEQTKQHELEQLNYQQALARLLQVVFGTWWMPERLNQHLDFLNSLIGQSQFHHYRLGFTADTSVVSFLRNKMK